MNATIAMETPNAQVVEGSDGLLLEIDGQIVPNYDATITPASVAARPGWGQTAAVTAQRVMPMPEDLVITRPGPRVVDGLRALAHAIHPDLVDG